MQKDHPLRISQESLDLDDIISDLNSEQSISNKKVAVPQRQVKQNVKQNVVQSARIGGAAGKSNKENDSGVMNRQQQQESTVIKAKYGIASENSKLQQTVETKAATNEKTVSDIVSSQGLGNQRYADSNIKSSAMNEMQQEEDEQLRLPPFYLQKGPAMVSVDEDVEAFQRNLDSLIVHFRGETMSQFMKTKKQVLTDQAQTIDAERRRCNTLLGVKQNEIEQLKESLASRTKLSDDLGARCEGMAFWAGKAKTLLRIKLLQHQAFDSLKKYRDFQKHSKKVLEHKLRQFRQSMKRKVFQGWATQYKAWKIVKNREDFDKAVKLELQHICAQYNKEIEGLREKLNEAQSIVESEHRNKAMMQEGLKKAFMRGVCALNFEAMNILNPNDQNQIEREMEKQVLNAMNSVAQQSPFTQDPQLQFIGEITRQTSVPNKINPLPVYQSASDHSFSPQSTKSFEQEPAYQERKMAQQLDSALQHVNPFSQNIAESTVQDYKRIESKDSMWRPAPIMGREINQQVVPSFTYSQPTITSQLKGPQTGVVLSSHFSKYQSNPNQTQTQMSMNTDIVQVMTKAALDVPSIVKVEEDTHLRTVQGKPTVIQGNISSLPDFVSAGNMQQSQGEGKLIIAPSQQTKIQSKPSQTTSQSTMGKKSTVVGTGSAQSKKK